MPRYPTHCTWCGCPVNTWTKGCEGCYTRFRSRYTRGVISSEEFEKLRAKYRPAPTTTKKPATKAYRCRTYEVLASPQTQAQEKRETTMTIIILTLMAIILGLLAIPALIVLTAIYKAALYRSRLSVGKDPRTGKWIKLPTE